MNWEYDTPRAQEELDADRKAHLAFDGLPEDTVYTCDSCDMVAKCKLSFEYLNRNGECLLDK